MLKNLRQKTVSIALIAASAFTPVCAANNNISDVEKFAGQTYNNPSLNCELVKREEAKSSFYKDGNSVSIEYECRPIIRSNGKSFTMADAIHNMCERSNLSSRIVKLDGKSPLTNGKPSMPLEKIMSGCTIFVTQDGIFDSYILKKDEMLSTTQEYRDFNTVRLFQTFKFGTNELNYKAKIILPSGDFI